MKSHDRKKNFGEVYTPLSLVEEILDQLPREVWEDKTKTFLDPTCGNGNFLICLKKRGVPLDNIYGVDILEDNCKETIVRLYTDIEPDDNRFEEEIKKVKKLDAKKDKKEIKEKFGKNWIKPGLIGLFVYNGKLVKNIVQADGLIYDYSFDQESENQKSREELLEELFIFE